MEGLQGAVVASKQQRIAATVSERHEYLSQLFFATRDKDSVNQVGSSFAPKSNKGKGREDATASRAPEEWLDQYTDLSSLSAMDLELDPMSPSPPASPSREKSASFVVEETPTDDRAKAELEEMTKTLIADSDAEGSGDADGDGDGDAYGDMDTDPPHDDGTTSANKSARPSVSKDDSEGSATPSAGGNASPHAKLATPLDPSSTLPSPLNHSPANFPIASTSAVPYATASPSNPSATPLPSIGETTISTPPIPGFRIPSINDHYPDLLPELPSEIFHNRLLSSVRKRPDKKGSPSGGPDLYKMHFKAVHTGAKNFLGKGKRVHNVLSTHEWGVGLEELRAVRAFERIETLKHDKAWSFRQPKKQRIALAPKAHWDNLLEEMRWLQTDFRQERRWKITTAYNLSRAVKKWHRASSEARIAMCIKVREPTFLPLNSTADATASASATPPPVKRLASREASAKGASTDGTPMDVDAEGDSDADGEAHTDADADADADADGEEADADGEVEDVLVTGNADSNPIPLTKGEADAARATAATSATPAEAQKQAGPHVQSLLTLRAPVFDLDAATTLIDTSDLAERVPEVGDNPSLSLINLFPDLPLYSDFMPTLEHQSLVGRRTEEWSAYAGRISQITHLLESKPILVSTLQPGRLQTAKGWDPATSAVVEDVKETFEPREQREGHLANSVLFAGRRPKDAVVGDMLPRAPATPGDIASAELRFVSLFWTPEEDDMVKDLQRQYGTNWTLMAETFNRNTSRPPTDSRLPWDIYDRWDKIAGPSSHKTLPDGTVISNPLPPYQPPVDKKPGQFTNFEGSKKRLRHLSVYDAVRKVQKKREGIVKPPPGLPRRINMSMHESHNLPPRPVYTPIEWSSVKTEQDAQRLRIQAQREAQFRMQQQAAQQQQAQAAQQQQQQNGVRYQQPVPQGFPIQPNRGPPGPINISQQQGQLPNGQGRPLGLSPSSSSSGLPGSPHPANQSPPISLPPNGQMPPQFGNQFPQQSPQQNLTPEQMAAIHQRQQQLIAMQRAAAEQNGGQGHEQMA